MTGPYRSQVLYPFAERRQDHSSAVVRLGVGTDHDGERARLRAGYATAHRRIREGHAARRQTAGYPAGGRRIPGRAIDQKRTGGESLFETLGALQKKFYFAGGRQTRNNHLRIAAGLSRGHGSDRSMAGGKLARPLGCSVPDGDRIACSQVCRHRTADGTEAEETDPHQRWLTITRREPHIERQEHGG